MNRKRVNYQKILLLKNRILDMTKRYVQELYVIIEGIMATKEADERERLVAGDR